MNSKKILSESLRSRQGKYPCNLCNICIAYKILDVLRLISFSISYAYYCALVLVSVIKATQSIILLIFFVISLLYLLGTILTYFFGKRVFKWLAFIPFGFFILFSFTFFIPNLFGFLMQDELYQKSPGTILAVGFYFFLVNLPLLLLSITHWFLGKKLSKV